MVKTFATLLLFQCLGETISFLANIPVPGPVIGMLLLLLALRRSRRIAQTVEEPSLALLKHLSLLFVPAGVGIMVYAESVETDIVPIAITILVGTAWTIAATALTANGLYRLSTGRASSPPIPAAHVDGDTGEPS